MSKNPVVKLIEEMRAAASKVTLSPAFAQIEVMIDHPDASIEIKQALSKILETEKATQRGLSEGLADAHLAKHGIFTNPAIIQLLNKYTSVPNDFSAYRENRDKISRIFNPGLSQEEKEFLALKLAPSIVTRALQADDLYVRLGKICHDETLSIGVRKTLSGLFVKRGLEIIREAEIKTNTRILPDLDGEAVLKPALVKQHLAEMRP
jgi:hypothetical protein